MKRKLRILRIWFFGKYNYLKKVHRWRMGQWFRDLQQISPKYYEEMVNKYQDESFTLLIEKMSKK